LVFIGNSSIYNNENILEQELKKMKNLSNFSIILFLLILAVIIQITLGALVRITDSGLSCPDWPLCYGLWFPFKERLASMDNINFFYYQIMLEWIHRLNAALIIAPLVVVLFVKSIIHSPYRKYRKNIIFIGFLVLLQSILGGVTVIDKNSSWSVSLHLSLALIFLFLVIRVFIVSAQFKILLTNKISYIHSFWLLNSLLVVFITMVLGAIVSKSGSALACGSWPLCNDDLILSSLNFNKTIHILHRLFAILSVLFILLFSIYKYRIKDKSFIVYLFKLPVALVLIQFCVGGLVIYSGVSIFSSIIHQSIAVILFTSLSILMNLNLYTFDQQKT